VPLSTSRDRGLPGFSLQRFVEVPVLGNGNIELWVQKQPLSVTFIVKEIACFIFEDSQSLQCLALTSLADIDEELGKAVVFELLHEIGLELKEWVLFRVHDDKVFGQCWLLLNHFNYYN